LEIERPEEFKANVIEAYHNASANGYSFEGYTVRDVALDMIAFDAYLEPYLPEDDDEPLITILVDILKDIHNG
jgi:hypothetical protein